MSKHCVSVWTPYTTIFDIPNKEKQLKTLEEQSQQPNFWNDPQQAQRVLKELRLLKKELEQFQEAKRAVEDTEVLWEFYKEGETDLKEVEEQWQRAQEALNQLELQQLLSSPEDKMDCYLEINAGAGGTESQDWVAMLARMYQMYANKKGFKAQVVEAQKGDTAGYKHITMEIQGPYAYGFLKGENGVHRLVRISPFDANKRRHTSFASVFVYPAVDDTIKIEIHPSELEWDTFRSSGKGGQHVNKVETAVRVRHIPTGIVVECQQERSQHQNRERALKILKSKLYQLELQKRQEERAKIEASKKKIEWGSQIRSYVLHPYKLVKDLRTGVETSNAQSVLDGEIEPFLKAYLLHQNRIKSDS